MSCVYLYIYCWFGRLNDKRSLSTNIADQYVARIVVQKIGQIADL